MYIIYHWAIGSGLKINFTKNKGKTYQKVIICCINYKTNFRIMKNKYF